MASKSILTHKPVFWCIFLCKHQNAYLSPYLPCEREKWLRKMVYVSLVFDTAVLLLTTESASTSASDDSMLGTLHHINNSITTLATDIMDCKHSEVKVASSQKFFSRPSGYWWKASSSSQQALNPFQHKYCNSVTVTEYLTLSNMNPRLKKLCTARSLCMSHIFNRQGKKCGCVRFKSGVCSNQTSSPGHGP